MGGPIRDYSAPPNGAGVGFDFLLYKHVTPSGVKHRYTDFRFD